MMSDVKFLSVSFADMLALEKIEKLDFIDDESKNSLTATSKFDATAVM